MLHCCVTSLSFRRRLVVWIVVLLSAAAPSFGQSSTPSPNSIEYFYGADLALENSEVVAGILLAVTVVAVALEYCLDRLKKTAGTFATIVAEAVLQELLICGLLTMFIHACLTLVSLSPQHSSLVRYSITILILMVLVFLVMVVLLTLGLVVQRRQWKLFEQTRMAADAASSAMDDVDAAAASAAAAAAKRLAAPTTVAQGSIDTDDDDENDPSAPTVAEVAKAEPTTRRSVIHSSGTKKAVVIVAPDAPFNTNSVSASTPGKRERRRALVYDSDNVRDVARTPVRGLRGRRDQADGESLSIHDRYHLGGSSREQIRKMTDFNPRQRTYTRCRDFWMETLHFHHLYDDRGPYAYLDRQLLFTDYVWHLSDVVVKLVADMSWKAWMVLALFVAVDGVRAVIVLGDNSDISPVVLYTSVGSFVVVGGFLPLGVYFMLAYRLEAGVERVSRKPLLKQHERENSARLVKPSESLFFRSVETTCQLFQITLLIFEWYVAVFFSTYSRVVYEQLGSASVLVFLGALLPVAIFLLHVPWTITIIVILTGLGADLKPEGIQAMRDKIRARAGELTDEAKRQLEEYETNLPGEWSPEREINLHPSVDTTGATRDGQEEEKPTPTNGTGPRSSVAVAPYRSSTAARTERMPPTVVVKPPPPAFHSLMPKNFLLPHEVEFFSRYREPVAPTAADSEDDDEEDEEYASL